MSDTYQDLKQLKFFVYATGVNSCRCLCYDKNALGDVYSTTFFSIWLFFTKFNLMLRVKMFLFISIQQSFSFQSHPVIGKGVQQASSLCWHELAALWEIPAIENELLLHSFRWTLWMLNILNFTGYRKSH